MMPPHFRSPDEEKKLIFILRTLDPLLCRKVLHVPRSERVEALAYTIVSTLKNVHLGLEHDFLKRKKLLRQSHSGVEYLGHKISLLPAKIDLFSVDFTLEDFKKLHKLITLLRREVNHV